MNVEINSFNNSKDDKAISSETVFYRQLQPPIRFGLVNSNVYRGAYPTINNFKYLHHMKLKTVLSLTPEKPTVDLQTFAKLANINLIHIPVNRLTNITTIGFVQILLKALTVLINSKNHPIYMHCLDGRKVVGLVVMLLRKLQLWSINYAIAEYWKYQISGRTQFNPMGPSEMEKSTSEIMRVLHYHSHNKDDKLGKGLGDLNAHDLELHLPENIPRVETVHVVGGGQGACYKISQHQPHDLAALFALSERREKRKKKTL